MDRSFDIQLYLNEGWELFKDNIANLVVAAIILVVINIAANFIPLASILVTGPLVGGMFYVIIDIQKGKPFNAMRMFDGFRIKLVPLVLVGILTTIFTIAGFMLLILPGFLVMGWYFFPYIFVVDKDMDFWPAMEASRQMGFENHMKVFLMALILATINFFGVLALGVGVLLTIPYSLCVIKKAYDHLYSTCLASSLDKGYQAPPPLSTPTTPI